VDRFAPGRLPWRNGNERRVGSEVARLGDESAHYADSRLAAEMERSALMQIDKEFILDELRKQGKNEHVQKAIQELPAKIDHNEHAALLEKFGLDPGKLAARAAERATS
jgi:hypothetical protein